MGFTNNKFIERFRFTRIDDSYDSDYTLMCTLLGDLPCVYANNDNLISEKFWNLLKGLNYKQEDVIVKMTEEKDAEKKKDFKIFKYYIKIDTSNGPVYFTFSDEDIQLDDDDFIGEVSEDDKKNKINSLRIFYTSNNINYIDKEIVPKIKEMVHITSIKNQFLVISTSQMAGYELRSSWVKDVDIDLELNYGKPFIKIDETIMKNLSNKKSGLYLFHGDPGCGKCVDGSSIITLRDKETGEIIEISIDDFYKLNSKK